jgi:hypothetical protein
MAGRLSKCLLLLPLAESPLAVAGRVVVGLARFKTQVESTTLFETIFAESDCVVGVAAIVAEVIAIVACRMYATNGAFINIELAAVIFTRMSFGPASAYSTKTSK